MKEIILTGIKPTGTPHIGNYYGAIKPAIDMSHNTNYDKFYFIADYHALNIIKDRKLLNDYIYQVAATWLACGLDPQNTTFYKQSDIPEIFELNWILNNVTPKGLINRAHAYKACVETNLENKKEADYGVNMGLFNYPILMASDILIMNANKVPVGQDQKQHVEITQEIARIFNNIYGDTFTIPEEIITKGVAIVPGTDGRKMSKSYNNVIPLFGTEQELKKAIYRIITDSTPANSPKDTNCTLFQIYSLLVSKPEVIKMANEFKKGISWSDVKLCTYEAANKVLAPLRETYNYYINNKKLIDKLLINGSKNVRKVAQDTLKKVRKLII